MVECCEGREEFREKKLAPKKKKKSHHSEHCELMPQLPDAISYTSKWIVLGPTNHTGLESMWALYLVSIRSR